MPSARLSAPERDSGLRAGDRAPDGVLQGAGGQTRRLFDLFRGPHWTLVARGVEADDLPEAGPRLHVHRVGTDGDFRDGEDQLGRTYGMAEGDILLVRPDGYVGALVSAAKAGQLADYLAMAGIGV